jgi:hypothetical protein
MSRRRYLSILVAGALVAVGWSSALAAAKPRPIAVTVPRHPRVSGNFTISFRPREPLPNGGYYYAVVVLTKRYAKRLSRARCAQASDMADIEYGYPDGHKLNLRLDPETSAPSEGQPTRLDWCAGATYKGAIYAVPHAPPCSPSEPCYGHTTAPECYPGEPRCNEGKYERRPKGKPAIFRRKPGELPTPQDSATRVIAHFRVHFARR